MKKILLSSIIMLGVCGAVNAQTGKGKKNDVSAASTSAAPAPTPQKAAIMPASDDVAAPVATKTAADKQAAAAAPASSPVTMKNKTAQAAPAPATVNAAGVVLTDDEKDIARKAAAEKAESVKKNQQ
jgi:hypothetical protein